MTQMHVIAHLNQPALDGRTLVLHPDAYLKNRPLPIPVTTTEHGTVGQVVLLTRIGDQIIAELDLENPDQHQDLLPEPNITVEKTRPASDGGILIKRWLLDSVQLVAPDDYPWPQRNRSTTTAQLRHTLDTMDDRLPDETPKAYARYVAYRDMPPTARSVERVANIEGINAKTLRSTAAKHKWVERVKVWDQRVATESGQAVINATATAAADLHTTATRLLAAAMEKAEAVVDGIDPEAITAQQAAVLRSILAGMTRVAVPETETAATNYATDPVRAQRIRELAAKAAKR